MTITDTERRDLRTPDELKALVEKGKRELRDGTDDEASAAEVAAWAAENFGESLAVACSMADAVLPHVVAAKAPGVDVLFLETGYHFPDTLATRAIVANELDVNIVDVTPEKSVAEQDEAYGKDLFARDPALCCQMRKVEPLAGALKGYEAWVTGVRREESPLRAKTPLIDYDAKNQMVKLNPLAAWTFDELIDYATEHDVPVNPLLADGYPSIGCQPCTRRVAPGEDPRAGRWAGFNKTECGLHT